MMRPKKSFGQHFLHDKGVIKKITDAVPVFEADVLVEVGPGTGALTRELQKRIKDAGERAPDAFILIEADRELADDLDEPFPGAQVVAADAAQVDFSDLIPGGKTWQLVGNLPYNAAAAIIMNALTSPNPPERLVVMVQKEQADRMCAKPGEMSVLSTAIQLYAKPDVLFTVGSGAFKPAPKVNSAVVKLVPVSPPEGVSREEVIQLAKAGFRSRRKQLHRNLDNAEIAGFALVKHSLTQIDLDPAVRAQALAVDDWIRLAKKLL